MSAQSSTLHAKLSVVSTSVSPSRISMYAWAVPTAEHIDAGSVSDPVPASASDTSRAHGPTSFPSAVVPTSCAVLPERS